VLLICMTQIGKTTPPIIRRFMTCDLINLGTIFEQFILDSDEDISNLDSTKETLP
jgi:hypothetical protein